jgi:glycosyltransferase involved in cell wall biosynthesis
MGTGLSESCCDVKKVLFIVNSPFLGGAEISALHFLRSLDTRRCRIFLLLPKNTRFPIESSGAAEVIYLPLKWFSYSANPFTLLHYFFNVLYCSWKIFKVIHSRGIDVIYSNTAKSQLYGSVAKFFSGKKCVLHVRDVPKGKFLKHFLVSTSDKIICISRFVDGRIGGPRSNKRLVYNGIDTLFFSRKSHSTGSSGHFKTVALVSQITPWKNLEDFLLIAKRIGDTKKNIHFLIAGNCLSKKDENYRDALLRRIKSERIHNIVFLGWIDDARDVYHETDVLIHTAIDEPFGRTIAEAMSMQIPVIAYNCGGPGEIVLDGVTGYLIEFYNYLLMDEKLLSLLDCAKLINASGRNGRQRIVQHFNLQDHARSIENLLLEI